MYFSEEDWRMHAQDLLEMFDPTACAIPGRLPADTSKAYLAASNSAAKAVSESWERYFHPSPESALKALFPGKAQLVWCNLVVERKYDGGLLGFRRTEQLQRRGRCTQLG
jgi:hypothetical protein